MTNYITLDDPGACHAHFDINNYMHIREFRKPYSYTSKATGKVVTTNEKMIELECDKCREIHIRLLSHYKKMTQKFLEFDLDYCNKCWVPILNNRPARIENMRNGLIATYNNNPALRIKMSNIVKGRNSGSANPMKRPEVRDKVSKTRSKLMEDPKFRAKFKQGSIDAWARGAYDTANTSGRTFWHIYVHSDGTEYKVQGKYELAFIKYLDKNNLMFTCHKGKIPYVDDDGLTHHYFPDFFVHDWNCWVDPKATYWYKIQYRKFELLKEQHPGIEIRILTEDKLKQLGIKL